MSIKATCPHCTHHAIFNDASAGKKVKCRKCGAVYPLPAEAARPEHAKPVAAVKLKINTPQPVPQTKGDYQQISGLEHEDKRRRHPRPRVSPSPHPTISANLEMPKLLTDVPFDTKLPVAHISSLSSLGILSITTLLFGIAFTIIGPFAVVGVRKELTPNKVAPSTPGIVESMIKSENQHVRNLGVVLVIVVFVTALALTPLGLIAIWFGWAWISVWISVWQGKEAMSASDTYPPDDDAEPDPRTPPFICPNCGQKRLYVEKRHSVQPVRCPSCMAALTPYSKLSTLNQQTPA